MNYLSIIIPPIIGAIIGYITNWLAVKMLFRPLKPVKIGKFKLPFTPGLIPKSKPRLAKALGTTISNNLLNNDDFISALLSEDALHTLNKTVENYLSSDISLKDSLISYSSAKTYDNILQFSSDKISSIVLKKLNEKNIGSIVSEQIQKVASEKMKGSLIGLFGGNSIISSLGEPIEKSINNYISENGKPIIQEMILEELSSFTTKNISELTSETNLNNLKLSDIITQVYIKFVTTKVYSLLEHINISSIIENKIMEMDLLDLEKLILSVMKNELTALVNLGALIGFILGLFNILF